MSKCGCEVLSCSDGSQAWEHLKGEDPPTVAVLDWMMPGMDGPEVCRRVRKSPNAASVYMILLTTRSLRGDIIAGLNDGADDYITKPFDSAELCARVRVGERVIRIQKQRLEQGAEQYVEQLDLAQAEIERSRERIVTVQEEARKHVAEELHGPVQSKLSMLIARLGDIHDLIGTTSQEAQKELAETATDLDAVRENDIRMVSHALYTSILDVGLQAGVKTLRDQFERQVQITLEFAPEVVALDPPGSSTIPFNVRLCLYRVAHEALANVVRHAAATHVVVQVSLDADSGGIVLAVRDDGRGFEPGRAQRGLGTLTMEDYIGAIGGSLRVDSAPGKGTRITARMPTNSASPQQAASGGSPGRP